MTRRVRSGSSQKHKKMPGNATKWGEFDNQHAREISPKKKKNFAPQIDLKQNLNSSSLNSLSSEHTESPNKNFFDEDKYCFSSQRENSNKINENYASDETSSNTDNDDNVNFSENKNPEIKKKIKKQTTFDVEHSSLDLKSIKIDSDEVSNKQKKIKLKNNERKQVNEHNICARKSSKESFSQVSDKKKRKKMKQNRNKVDSKSLSINEEIEENSLSNVLQKEMCSPNHVSFDNCNAFYNTEQDTKCMNSSDKTSVPDKSFQDTEESSKTEKTKKHDKLSCDSTYSSMNVETCKNSATKPFASKKEKYLRKLQKKREKLGLLPLSRNVECKLHKIKKRLIEKGFPPEMQKEIMRKARRKEELKFQKIFNPSRLCFNCREAGHVLADCPKKSESLKQETGICFKCGSVEHTSFKCPKNVQGFPFATCFICKEQGHISRDCPQNKRGVYPKGGRCMLCGNVNHLKKDCPTLKKKVENEEESITLHTLNNDASIDAEVVKKEEIEMKPEKKAKIINF